MKYEKVFGKPNLEVYKFLLEKINNLCPDTNKLFIVGYINLNIHFELDFSDNMLTDIYGANVLKKYLKDENIPIEVVAILVRTGISKGDAQCCQYLNLLNDSIEKNPEFAKPDFIFDNILECIQFFYPESVEKLQN